jgi:hypothetical protein
MSFNRPVLAAHEKDKTKRLPGLRGSPDIVRKLVALLIELHTYTTTRGRYCTSFGKYRICFVRLPTYPRRTSGAGGIGG